MKRIFTLFFSLAVLALASSAQERNHYNDRDNNGYQYRSSDNGYRDYRDNDWKRDNDGRFDEDRRFDRDDWKRRERIERRREQEVICNEGPVYHDYDRDNYWHRKNVVFSIVVGKRHRF